MKKILVAVLALLVLAPGAIAQVQGSKDVRDVRVLRSTWGYVKVETAEEFDYNSTAVTVDHNSTTGTTYGLMVTDDSNAGTAVYGEVSATTGQTYGFNGICNAPVGAGVRGEGSYGTGAATTMGVEGKTAAPYGTGVYGHVSATDGCAAGVHGAVAVDSSWGVRGTNIATSGNAVGVQGETINGSGVVGTCSGTAGVGVYGWATNTLGGSYGVYAQTNGPTGIAVYAAGPITCSMPFYQALCPTNVYPPTTGGTYVIDETNGIYAQNVDDTDWYVAFEVPQSVLYYGDCTLDSLVLTFSTNNAADTCDIYLMADFDDCGVDTEVDTLVMAGAGTDGCETYNFDNVLGVSLLDAVFFLKIDACYDVAPDAGDIKIERLELYGTFATRAAGMP